MAKGTKYIYHSENTNSTCNDCKKHDKEIYYDIKDIPKLPIHPNCRCWIETADVSVSNNIECDCKDRIKVIKNNVEGAVINVQNLLDSVDSCCLDIEIDFENISNILENLNVKKDEIYDEIGKHNKDCKNNVDNLYKEIEDNINNLKLLNNKSEKISDELYSLRRNSSLFLNKAKNKLVDINITEEYLDKTYHTKGECKSNNKLKEYSKSVSDVCSSVDDYWHKFKSLKDEIKKIEDAIKDNKKVVDFIKNKKHLPCSCKMSEVVLKGKAKKEVKKDNKEIKEDNKNKKIKTETKQEPKTKEEISRENATFSEETIKRARDFIVGEESFSPHAYDDKDVHFPHPPVKPGDKIKGTLTIGYGHTKGVKPGDTITKEKAEELYRQDFKEHSDALKAVTVPLTENQKVALASFIYNVGISAFKNSTLLKKLNSSDYKGAANEFEKWIKGDPGLKDRRKKERELFLTPD